MGAARRPADRRAGDLARLLSAIEDGFGGTAQPLPGERRTTVWYLETGFQTTIPAAKRRFYRGEETDPYVVPPLAPEGAEPWVRDQASQLRDALFLARCQPAVGAFFNFELLDEDRLAGWQSGVLWRDGTHKPSYDAFKAAVELVRSGALDCSTVPGAGGPLPPAPPEEPGSHARLARSANRVSSGLPRRKSRRTSVEGAGQTPIRIRVRGTSPDNGTRARRG